ncbi:Thiol-disulfide isomerase or thioredoxin [Desulfotomaculum arcticum]|uniref:Thiol-disulfide isomerase or thioredoxin n=1 Tax=Desulfotruncus arcticus DSM 17038 TaxID=1121424 RepID=A0A1I2TVW1_9FIRM|nr:TlpA disulfide reductase family protein [Desulfotruncus arcticus]SFG69035.1 Thiol-disulfide isomerase or thioredoxin [Desulfotomaculum arcticum] [Desulfotruncus arcticus DSM 17038]
MKPKILTAFVVVVIVAVGMWLAKPGPESEPEVGEGKLAGEVSLTAPGEQKTVQPDKVPPDFFLISKDSEPVALSEIKDQYIFINFWNTWCPPCQEEMPELNKLYLEYANKNVKFIFINIAAQEKSVDDVTAYLRKHGYSIPVYLDTRADVAMVYGIRGIPTTIILNPQGQVIYAESGPISYEKAKGLITD